MYSNDGRMNLTFLPPSEIHTMKFTLLQYFCWKQKKTPKLTSYIVWVDIRDDLQHTKTVVCAFIAKQRFLLLIAPFRTSPRWKALSQQ